MAATQLPFKQLIKLWALIKKVFVCRVLVVILSLFSAAIICFFEVFFRLTVRPWSRRLYQRIDCFLSSHLGYPTFVFMLQWWSGTTFEIISDNSLNFGKEHAIVLSSHKSFLDVFLLIPVADYFGILGNLRFFTKKILQYFPVIGWSFRLHDYPLLERNWNKDKIIFSENVKDLIINGDPGMLVLYPEGSRFTKEKHQESMLVAKQKGFQEMKHHLLPRTRGFVELVKTLKNLNFSGVPVAVYDILIGVSSTNDKTDKVSREIPVSTKGVLDGKAYDVKVLIRRYPIQEIPEDEIECSNWLRKRFGEKDGFYDCLLKTGNFFDEKEDTEYKDFKSVSVTKKYYTLINYIILFAILVTFELFSFSYIQAIYINFMFGLVVYGSYSLF